MILSLIILINCLCMGTAWIWTIVLGFKTSPLWGFLNMIPFVGFIWMITHQEEAAAPFKLCVGGLVFLFLNFRWVMRAWRVERTIDRIEHASAHPPKGRASASFDGDTVIVHDPRAADSSDTSEDEESDEDMNSSAETESPDSRQPDQAPAAPAAAQAAATPTPTTEQRLAQTNANLDVAAGMLNRMGPQNGQAGGSFGGTLTASNRAPLPQGYLEDAPVETIWTQYYTAVSHVQAGDPRGIREFEICLCSEDALWLRQNMTAMAELISPGLAQTNPQDAQLAVLQAMLRNMPTTQPRTQPEVTRSKSLKNVAVARLATDSPSGPQYYTTFLSQESGRWVLVQPFFARTFVWTPQLAQYKQANGLPLALDEQRYLAGGFAPFQQQIQSLYTTLGFKVK